MQTTKTQITLSTPFSKSYWKSALLEIKNIKTLSVVSVLIALQLVISSIYIPLPLYGTQRIYFTFIISAVIALAYGPFVGLYSAIINDLLGFVLHPQGPFFAGYILTAVVTSFIFSLFLYRARLSILRLFLSRFFVNLIANILLNSLWDSILIGKGYFPLMLSRIPKNLIMLPIEVIIFVAILGFLIPFMKREGFIKHNPLEKKIPWI